MLLSIFEAFEIVQAWRLLVLVWWIVGAVGVG